MDNNKLRSLVQDFVIDDDVLDDIVLLEGDEFADGAIGLSEDNRVVYSYERLVHSLSQVYGSETDAMEWLDYNTIRSLPYIENAGLLAPIIIHEF